MATGRGKPFESGILSGRRLSGTKNMIKSKIEGHMDRGSKRLLHTVFQPPDKDNPDPSATNSGKDLTLASLPFLLETELSSLAKCAKNAELPKEGDNSDGRVGPESVVFDINGHSGTLVIEADRLGVASHSNFSTIHSNTCVFKGQWMYELMLGSKGVMQVGWCTFNCHFSQEEGVGDTPDSYAYDGNRLRKWNVRTVKYGEPWLTGDVISCAIDCDEGSITFYRNGVSMGMAFSDLKLGPQFSYFPAVSLSMGEYLRANFGATPLRYPLPGYRALQDPPTVDLVQAMRLSSYLEHLLPSIVNEDQKLEPHPTPVVPVMPNLAECRGTAASLQLMVVQIFDKLAPFLRHSYIVEACLMNLLLQFTDSTDMFGDQPHVQKVLDFLWAFMQEHELKPCLDFLMMSLVSCYRFSPVTRGFQHQTMYLTLVLAIVRHEVTRKHLLKCVLFDKIKFPIFMHVKPPVDVELAYLVPTVWLGVAGQVDEKDEDGEASETMEDLKTKEEYLSLCNDLRKKVQVVENLQVEILKELLNNRDQNKGPSSRFVFLYKFRDFLKDNSTVSTRCHLVIQCPIPVILCFFHRLIQAVRYYWDYHASHFPDKTVQSTDAYVPCRRFYDDSIQFFGAQRLGGLLSHLKKAHKEDLHAAQVASESHEHKSTFDTLLQRLSMISDSPKKNAIAGEEQDMCSDVSAASLIEILDGIVYLYHIAAHKQLGKMCSLRDSVTEYVEALKDTEQKLTQCPDELDTVRIELERARSVFVEKATELIRHMAWVTAVIYSPEKQEDVFWLLRCSLRTVEKASKEEKLFAFVPDYYVDVILNTYNALRGYFNPTISYKMLEGFDDTLVHYAQFLSDSVTDARIVQSDVRDNLVQSLACCVCYQISLHALERIPEPRQSALVGHLLAPYEGRSWAQTNWILVRLWKGNGFGFRYKHLPHLLPSKNQQQEIGNASLQRPCPSLVYQLLVAKHLRSDITTATKLIDSILNQLNWAFSEFIGMMQELQQVRLRPITVVDMRQLKISATCFDISVGLLRVLEMILSLVPELVTDWQQPSAELLLCRLFQLLTQVLNRVTSKSNLFDLVTSINVPCLETVDHFPILTAITGIMLRLVTSGSEVSRERATAALLAEPGFQLTTLEFLLGETSEEATSPPPEEKKLFSLRNYKEINESEVSLVETLITYLREEEIKSKLSAPEIDEDTLCSICYARPKSVQFKPCNHESCKACISHHMMSKKDCFFCKAEIKTVMDVATGKPITITSKETTV